MKCRWIPESKCSSAAICISPNIYWLSTVYKSSCLWITLYLFNSPCVHSTHFVCVCSVVSYSVTLWTVALQALLLTIGGYTDSKGTCENLEVLLQWALQETSLISGLGRSLGGRKYSCLENPMDRGTGWVAVHRAKKIQIWLSMHAFIVK